VAVVLASCGGKEERKAMHMEKGMAYYAQGDYDKARVELKNVLQIDPKTPEAYYMIGLIEEKQQKWQGAFSSYLKAVELNPDHIQAKVKLGRLYLLSGALREAEEIMTDVLARRPGDPGGRFLKAAVLVRRGDIPGAIQEANEVVAADPAQTDAISLLAGLYTRQGDDARAEQVLEKGISAAPKDVSLRVDLAAVALRRNEPVTAEKAYVELVALDPQTFQHRVALVNFYIRSNQLDKAERILRDSIRAAPEDHERHLLLVEFLAAHKGAEQAERQLLSSIQAEPKAYPLRFGLARLYQLTGRPEQAEKTYRDIISTAKTGPEGLKARVFLARMKLRTGDAAEQLIAEVLKENPRDTDALQLRAQISLANGNVRQSISDLRAVLKDRPDSIEVMSWLALAHAANGEPQLAKDVFSNAIVRYPNNANLRVGLAEFLASNKDYDAALKAIDTALNADPQIVRAYEVKAEIQVARNDPRAAEQALIELKTALPTLPVGYYRLGSLYKDQKKYDQAIAEFEQALERAPNEIEPLTAIVYTLLEQRKPEKALERINAAIRAAPSNPLAYSLLGNVYAKQNRYAEAETTFRKAIQIGAKIPAPYLGLANLYLTRSDAGGAVGVLKQGLEASPGDLSLSYLLAAAYQRAGDNAKAIAEYEKILARNPSADIAANNLAALLAERRDSKASLERALELSKRFENSANPSFLDTLGWTYFQLGQYQRAVPILEEATRLAPTVPTFHYHLGMAQYKQGDLTAAKRHLKLAIEAKLDFPGIDEANATLASM